mgnify:CR=1 FL=1
MAKRRSDIAKLVSFSRQVWRQSLPVVEVKRTSKVPGKTGWFFCKKCQVPHEVIKIDHIEPIGKQPDVLSEFGSWLSKLFCGVKNLQALCALCHKDKTKEDNRRLKNV